MAVVDPWILTPWQRYCFEEPGRRPFAYAPPQRIEVDLAAECGR